MNHSKAYWISPEGKVYAVDQTHIVFIIENVGIFDLDIETIKTAYKKHNEKLRHEGKARNEIIEDLLKKGWIRLRYREKNNAWHVNHCSEPRSLVARLKIWYEKYEISKGSPSFNMIRIYQNAIMYDHNTVQEFLYDDTFIKNCLNCRYSTWAVGIGQGFFCRNSDKISSSEFLDIATPGKSHISSTGFKRFFIPSREYKCEHHSFNEKCGIEQMRNEE